MTRLAQIHVIATVLLCACAHGTDGTRQSLTVLDETISATAKAFGPWDTKHQNEIIDKAKVDGKTKAEVQAELDSYYVKQAEVVKAIHVIEKLIASTVLFLALVDRGLAADKAVDGYLKDLFAVFKKLTEMLEAFGFDVHGLPKGASP